MIRLFVSDIDGTLVNEKSEFEQETIDAIRQFQDLGGIFMVATGRNFWELKQFTSKLDKIVFNCANGSMLANEERMTIISCPIREDTVRRFYGFTKEHCCIGQYHCADLCCSDAEAEIFYSEALAALKKDKCLENEEAASFFHKVYDKKQMKFGITLEEILKHEVLKMEILFIDKERFPHLLERFRELFPECALAPETFMHNIEVSSADAGKGKLIKQFCLMEGIKEDEVAVIGDSSNDIDMLCQFANSYAMGNASNKVKRHARYIADDNRHHGVAKVLKRIMEENAYEQE